MGRKYSRARMASVGGGILSPLLSCGRLAFGCGSPCFHVVASPSAAAPPAFMWSPRLRLRLPLLYSASPSAAAPPALLGLAFADGELDSALGCGAGGLPGRAHR